MLEKTEGAIMNGQSRETQEKYKNKTNTTQKTKKTSNMDPPKTEGGQLWKDEQHGPTKNQGWATMKRRATRTHQKPGVGNYEKTSNMDPPKTRGGQL